jgi:hypothetical protein
MNGTISTRLDTVSSSANEHLPHFIIGVALPGQHG